MQSALKLKMPSMVLTDQFGFGPATAAALLLHWEFEEGAGAVIGATVGPGGSLATGAWGTGILGTNAVDLDLDEGTSDSAISFNSGLLSLSCWIRPDNAAGRLITTENALTSGGGYFVVEYDAGKISARMVNSSGELREESPSISALINQWVHLVVTLDSDAGGGAGAIKIYINSILQSTTPTVATKSSGGNFASDSIIVGNSAVDIYDGLMDDLRIYNYLLSASQVQTLTAAPPTVFKLVEGEPFVTVEGELLFV